MQLSGLNATTETSIAATYFRVRSRHLPGRIHLRFSPAASSSSSSPYESSKETKKSKGEPLRHFVGLGLGVIGALTTGIPTQKSEQRDTLRETTLNFEKQKSVEKDPASAQPLEDMESLAKGGSLFKKNALSHSPGAGKKESPEAPLTLSEETKMMADVAKLNSLSIRYNKFKAMLELPNIDLEQLKKLSWSGIPEEIRPTVWKLLMGYLPVNSDRRESTLTRKRKEYEDYVEQTFGNGRESLDQALIHQIHIDVQRTNAHIPLYQSPVTQETLERILYSWAIRHPASGYVQGINDLVTPFFQVYLQESVGNPDKIDMAGVAKEVLLNVESDCFWCLTKLLDGIQDNYTHAQPGIQRQIVRLKELINRIDAPLYAHLTGQGVEFIQFAFRWMNCLLMRELSLKNTIRMWDTYMSEGTEGFSDFHLYVCAAFLVKWSDKLKKMEFQDVMMFVQSLPTSQWEDKEIELLLSEAFMWKSLFHNSPSHLASVGSSNQ